MAQNFQQQKKTPFVRSISNVRQFPERKNSENKNPVTKNRMAKNSEERKFGGGCRLVNPIGDKLKACR